MRAPAAGPARPGKDQLSVQDQAERYDEADPPAALKPFIRKIWTYAAPSPSGEVQRIAPDGCPELVIDLGAPYEEEGEDGVFRLQPSAIFAGQMTRPLAIRPAGPVELVAMRFEPDGARDWLGRPMIEATDRRLDMVERTRDLKAALSSLGGDPAGQVALAVRWLEQERRDGDWRIDPVVRAEVAAMAEDRPEARDPAAQRALQRRFRDRVGASPRILRSIFRFRRVFDHAEDGGWLQAGLEAGYFDQPQMARDFRRFLGCTATDWARQKVELARLIASQTYKPDGAAQV